MSGWALAPGLPLTSRRLPPKPLKCSIHTEKRDWDRKVAPAELRTGDAEVQFAESPLSVDMQPMQGVVKAAAFQFDFFRQGEDIA